MRKGKFERIAFSLSRFSLVSRVAESDGKESQVLGGVGF